MDELDAVAVAILNQLLGEACQECVLPAFFQEKKLRAQWGKAEVVLPTKGELTQRAALFSGRGVDLYGQEKSTETRYYRCDNCERQVAGTRFAAHVARCVTRGRRQRAEYFD